jgi:hypothetical protein
LPAVRNGISLIRTKAAHHGDVSLFRIRGS